MGIGKHIQGYYHRPGYQPEKEEYAQLLFELRKKKA